MSSIEQAVAEAAQWFARFGHEDISEDDVQQWQNWLEQSPVNQQAWAQVEQIQQKMSLIPGQLAASTLMKSTVSRRALLSQLGLVTLAAPLLSWQLYQLPWQHWQADHQTAVGEQHTLTLDDGSQLIMNTQTTIDIEFSHSLRLVKLHQGEIYIHTAEQDDIRSFIVQTAQGRMQALGTRFSVKIVDDQTVLQVFEHTVRILPDRYLQQVDISAHQQTRFSSKEQGNIELLDQFSDSWRHGSLMVVDMPLRKLLAELSRYRHGYLGCEDTIAHLSISGAFPIADTDSALNVLSESFPIKKHQISRYWVRFEADI